MCVVRTTAACQLENDDSKNNFLSPKKAFTKNEYVLSLISVHVNLQFVQCVGGLPIYNAISIYILPACIPIGSQFGRCFPTGRLRVSHSVDNQHRSF